MSPRFDWDGNDLGALTTVTVYHSPAVSVFDGHETTPTTGELSAMAVGIEVHDDAPPVLVADKDEEINIGDLILVPEEV